MLHSTKLLKFRGNCLSYAYLTLNQACTSEKNSGDSKNQKNLTKVHFNVGTIGHVGASVSTLKIYSDIFRPRENDTYIRDYKIAKYRKYEDIDNAPEERNRGVTINASRLGYETQNRHYAHMDCPGHADYIKNMITGTSQMDGAILVIAADDGVMAQTREHLLLARDLGVKEIVVFINKADLVGDEVLFLVELELSELLSELGFDVNKIPIVKGSALDALQNDHFDSINRLLEALDSLSDPVRNTDGPFVMPIASVQPIRGRGTVIIGTIESGKIQKGQSLEVCGFNARLKANVTDIHVFNKSFKELSAGDHCGILCKGEVRPENVDKGMWLTSPGSVSATNFFRVHLYLLSENESGRKQGIRPGFSDNFFCTTWNSGGRLHFDRELLMPGESVDAWVFLTSKVPILRNYPLSLREHKKRTIAKGIITDIYYPFEVNNALKVWKNFSPENIIKDARLIS